jgi:hypothetical protein
MHVYRALKARFPERSDNLVVVVEADTPDRARDAADLLADRLAANDSLARVHRPDGGAFLARNGLLYLDVDELLDLLDSLAASSPLIQRLRDDPSLRGLFAVITLAAADAKRLDDLDWLFGRMAAVIEARLDGRPVQLSWHEIMWGSEADAGDRRAFVIARLAALDYDSLLPGANALDEVRRAAAEAGLVPEKGISVRGSACASPAAPRSSTTSSPPRSAASCSPASCRWRSSPPSCGGPCARCGWWRSPC